MIVPSAEGIQEARSIAAAVETANVLMKEGEGMGRFKSIHYIGVNDSQRKDFSLALSATCVLCESVGSCHESRASFMFQSLLSNRCEVFRVYLVLIKGDGLTGPETGFIHIGCVH